MDQIKLLLMVTCLYKKYMLEQFPHPSGRIDSFNSLQIDLSENSGISTHFKHKTFVIINHNGVSPLFRAPFIEAAFEHCNFRLVPTNAQNMANTPLEPNLWLSLENPNEFGSDINRPCQSSMAFYNPHICTRRVL